MYDVSESNEAQQKFGKAKAISSEQYFGNKDIDVSLKIIN